MTLVYVTVAWVSGMLLADLVRVPAPVLGVLALWAVAVALVEGAHPARRHTALLVLVALVGCWRWQAAQSGIAPGDLAAFNDTGTVRIEGYISADPVRRETRQQVELTAETVAADATAATVNGVAVGRDAVDGVVLITTALYPHYTYGQRLAVTGRLETPAILDSFDYREYLASQGIASTMRSAEIEILPGTGGSWLARALSQARAVLRLRIEQILPHPEAGLLQGILLGLDHTLPADLAEAFRVAGLTHIIVISGYNISILLQAWYAAGTRLLHRWVSLGAGLGVLLVFVLLVGPSPPVVRAAIMSAMFVLAQLAGRRDWPLASLALSALAMTAVNPLLLHSVSFQLSIASTLALIVLQPRLAASLEMVLRGADGDSLPSLSHVLGEVVLTTCAAQLFTLPIIWAHFGRVSLLALLANVLVLPLQPLILVPGAAVVFLSVPAPGLGRMLGYALWLPLRWTILVARWIGEIPWAAATLPPLPPAGAWLLYALIMILVWRLPIRRLSQESTRHTPWRVVVPVAAAAVAVALLWLGILSLPDGRLHVYVLDVGQGDAILLRTAQGHAVLIDGGPDPVLLASRLGDVLPFWERDIDLVLVTHDDTDHIGGLAPIASRYRVGKVIHAGQFDNNAASVAWQAALDSVGIAPVSLGRGAEIRLGDSLLTVLHTATALGHNGPENNDQSLVVMLQQGRFRMLLTGDAGEAVERRLLAMDAPLNATALKVSHHGARSATSAAFLEAVTPQVALISVGADNRYGHPADAVVQRLEGANTLVLRTDERGTIELATDGAQMWIKTAR
ncbi:MAG: DNA internalization-related competence protein ComEC/Rec2 [Anaerolineae bacterium]